MPFTGVQMLLYDAILNASGLLTYLHTYIMSVGPAGKSSSNKTIIKTSEMWA